MLLLCILNATTIWFAPVQNAMSRLNSTTVIVIVLLLVIAHLPSLAAQSHAQFHVTALHHQDVVQPLAHPSHTFHVLQPVLHVQASVLQDAEERRENGEIVAPPIHTPSP